MIAIDWGTSSLRAFLLDAKGGIVDSRRSSQGVLASAGHFETVLRGAIEGWDDPLVIMAGMIGSRQGWREMPYVECPAGLAEIAAGMSRLETHGLRHRDIWIAPGLSVLHASGIFDVMRGEETQICGLNGLLEAGGHLAILAGTHSKCVRIADRKIVSFCTAMTGELFDILTQHSILGKLMQPGEHDSLAFAEGVARASLPGDILNHLFAARTQALFGVLKPAQLRSYLSGILIGHELNDIPPTAEVVHLVAAQKLLAPYKEALALRGFQVQRHSETASAQGLYALALCRGLFVPAVP